MSDEQTKSTEAPNPQEPTPPVWPMPFQEVFEEMMKRCSCRPEQMDDLWATCCGQPREKQAKDHAL